MTQHTRKCSTHGHHHNNESCARLHSHVYTRGIRVTLLWMSERLQTEKLAGVQSGLVVQTEAVFNPSTGGFTLNTPNIGARKNWISQVRNGSVVCYLPWCQLEVFQL